MDFFERAHVPKKTTSKSDDAVKKQLKQMLYAYNKGNNEGIISSSEINPKYDFDESISISDFSEISGIKGNKTSATVSSAASSESFSAIDNNSDELTEEDSVDDVTDLDGSKSSVSASENPSTSLTKSSAIVWSDSNDSDTSMPSSLKIISDSGSDVSEKEQFDADGALATEILQKLSKKDKGKKRKIPKEIEIITKELPADNKTTKDMKKTKKSKKTDTSLIKIFIPEQSSSYIESDLSADNEMEEGLFKKTPKKEKQRVLKKKKVNDSYEKDLMDIDVSSESSISSSPFISVSAEDMLCQSLSELLGDYVHPTIKNLNTETLNIPMSEISSMFPTDSMHESDMIEEEISSLVPEVDEDLVIEDLNHETDTQEPIDRSAALNDTTGAENTDEILEPAIIQEPEIVPPPKSDFIMNIYNGSDSFIVIMKNTSELHIHGKVRVTAISGTVDIFGYLLQDSSLDVYAPYSHHAQCVKPVDFANLDLQKLKSKLVSAGVSITDISEILSHTLEFGTIIQLSKLNSRKMEYVDNNFPTDLFTRRGDNVPRFLKKASDCLCCSFYVSPPSKSFQQKPIWDTVLSCGMISQSRGLVCGGKSTGKSTFLRHYINRSLPNGPVVVLDLDPGQSEFTIPGSVSVTVVDTPIIGPNFTHLKTPDRMLNIGIINTMDNPKRYLSAVTELIAYCRANDRYKQMPWIVNTMGMCNHMGLKFMTYIILQLRPTFLFQIDSKVPKRRYEVDLDPPSVLQLYHDEFRRDGLFRNIQEPYSLFYSFLIARPEDNGPKNSNTYGALLVARDERYLNILAYFGELLNEYNLDGIMDIVPYEVNMKDLSVGLNVKIPAGTVTQVINGKIIALCQREPGDNSGVFTLGDKPLLCHGHGLIRGISDGVLYIITPIEFSKLRLVDTLVYGDWMPELRGQERDLPDGVIVPYRTAYTVQQHRKLMYPPRRRFNPLQLLRSRKS